MPLEFNPAETRKAGTFNHKMKPNTKTKDLDNYEFSWPSPGGTKGPHVESFAKAGTGVAPVENFLKNTDMELIKSYAKDGPYGYVKKDKMKRLATGKGSAGSMRQGGGANAAHGYVNESK